jgi:murein DD-endopeptidase MepM/ murein hydrolase activator NlpD
MRTARGFSGVQYAVLDGRRCPFFSAAGGRRALVPVPATLRPGAYTMGIELRTRRGRQRIPLKLDIRERQYPQRTVVLPDDKRSLAIHPEAVREGRKVQLLLRTETPRQLWSAPFRPPVAAEPVSSYGRPTSYVGAFPVEATTDAVHGEYHRGIDYAVPPGTAVRAPAAGTVLMAGDFAVTGRTLVIDHGQGVVSVFFHLDRLDVVSGEPVAAGTTLALSGQSGLAASPHVHWAVYVHGVAVDPRALEGLG